MVGCDLLSNSYLCSICDSASAWWRPPCRVVICFQILTFAVSATAQIPRGGHHMVLWFAFKFLPLQYLRQRPGAGIEAQLCCDLLSNSYLCSICDSRRRDGHPCGWVVICFQILTFAVSATAEKLPAHRPQQLWFAFKFLPLQYLRQPVWLTYAIFGRCDLLSNSYLCSICDSSNTTNSWIRDH